MTTRTALAIAADIALGGRHTHTDETRAALAQLRGERLAQWAPRWQAAITAGIETLSVLA